MRSALAEYSIELIGGSVKIIWKLWIGLKMRYFFDCEFIEDGQTIDLISIGIVCEDGREYYAINKDCDFSKASDWVEENVLNPIGLSRDWGANIQVQNASPNTLNSYMQMKIKYAIAIDVVAFMNGASIPPVSTSEGRANHSLKEGHDKPEIWAYYADYDWVAFCQLFGTMMDLPKGFPMYCRDVKQWCDMLGNPKLPTQGLGEHNALNDARWTKMAWEFLRDFK